MKQKYFLCVMKWDAQKKCEVEASRSQGYETLAELLSKSESWIEQNLGQKFYIQKYYA